MISVILPVYNGMPFLKASVKSLLNQNFSQFELLIVDDCSTDGSWEYINSLTDHRVKIYRNKVNKGLFSNLNFLTRNCASPIIKLWSQDDIMYENCLKEIVSFHELHPEISFSYSGRDYIDENGMLTGSHLNDPTPEIISKELHAKISFFTGSIAGNIANVAINRKYLNMAGEFNEKMIISGDFEMWIRLSNLAPVGFIKENLIQLRNHVNQLSRKESYYILHVKEDFIAYGILMNSISPNLQKEGRKIMRNHKLTFYYTLMAKAFIRGEFKMALEYFLVLKKFDNFFCITMAFLKRIFLGVNKFSI